MLLLFIVAISLATISCSSPVATTPPGYNNIDTTPPVISSVYTSPSPILEDHPFTLYVNASDDESEISISYDMNNDGVFNDSNTGSYPSAGTKTIAVKAQSEGGYVINYYNLNVNSVILDLYLSYTAGALIVNGQFQINYTISNYSNVRIRITDAAYVIKGSSKIKLLDIVETNDTLVLGNYISPNDNISATLAGYSVSYIPCYFDFGFTYDDGYGNSKVELFYDGVFTLY